MSPKRKAKILAEAVRTALSIARGSGDLSAHDKRKISGVLAAALEKVADKNIGRFTFVTTPNVFSFLTTYISGQDDGSDEHAALLLNVSDNSRITSRRVYISLDINYPQLQRLRDILLCARRSPDTPYGIRRACDRFIISLEQEVLNVSPLEHLARTGL